MRLIAGWLLILLAGLAPDDETLDAGVAGLLESELERGFEADPSKLFLEVVRVHGDVDLLLDRLEEITDSDEQGEARRLAAKWVLAGVLRRYGNLKWSLELTEELAQAAGDDAGVVLQQAQLLDARGSAEEALEAYERLLDLLTDETQLARARLRIAMIRMQRDKDAAGALADLVDGEQGDTEAKNRAAVVLALLGRPRDAIDLFEVSGEGRDRFRQEVRVAEWAIRANDPVQAQEYAWDALFSATLRRDRHYALTVLVEAYRMNDSLDFLIERFAQSDELPPAARNVWIDLLRETGRTAGAIALFRDAREGDFDVAMRRELLEMYREAGQEDVMCGVFAELIAEEPTVIEWREGLSRFLLERGNRDEAEQVWTSFVRRDAQGNELLWGADALADLGLDALAIECAETYVQRSEDPSPALLFLFGLHKDRGDLPAAEAVLERLDRAAPPEAAARLELAESYEQLGRLDRAVRVLEGVRDAREEGEIGEDLEMRLSWLYSEVGDEDKAMASWLELWRRIQSIPRRRYVEDRLMTVASRLGTLADVAIELEDKLAAGTADARESGLLVRLYTKVSDPVSATEVVEEFMKQTGGNVVETLQEKARVYVACTDFHNYEEVVRELMVVDPEGLGDYLRQLAMSQLERGRPDEAREVLLELKDLEADSSDSAEFEAGVLALAGMRDEAIVAYRKGLAEHPERIDSYLLMADLMKATGETELAVGMFQQLAESADRDDLFTVAIDGLLNMEAPAPVLNWARRITLERLAGRHDKMYLYQLLSDLSEELGDRGEMLTALENSLAISGERRPSVLRELMDLAKGGGTPFGGGGGGGGGGAGEGGDTDKHLAFGRRLIGLEELVPPGVYLDLGEAFLKADDVANAAKTFRLAHELPDYDVFQRQAADLFESSGYLGEALGTYERVLVTDSSDVGLMAKVAELQEQMGRDAVARGLYLRAIELLLLRRPQTVVKADEKQDADDPFAWYAARNVDDFDQFYERVLKGLLVTLPAGEVDPLLTRERERIGAELEAVVALAAEREPKDEGDEQSGPGKLNLYPRLMRRAELYRRLALAYGKPALADTLDLELLKHFDQDESLLEELAKQRIQRGYIASARSVIERSGRPADQVRKVLFLVGEGVDEGGQRLLPMAEASGLFLPLLISDRREEAKGLLRRIDLGQLKKEELPGMSALFSAGQFLDDPDLILHLGRQWLRMHVKHGSQEYELQPVLDRCRSALDPERSRSLCQYFVSLVLEDPEKTSGLITMLPRLQSLYEQPLVSEEQVLALLDDYGDAYAWGLGPVLKLLPAPERAAALRRIWPKVQNTFKATFLVQMVSQFQEPLGEELSEFIGTAFGETLEDATNLKYYVDQLHQAEENPETVLRMAEALVGKSASDWASGALRAVMLSKTGRNEEALEVATEVYVGLRDSGADYYLRRAQEHVEEEFLPEHFDAFAARLERVRAEQGDSVELALKEIDLSYETDDPERSHAAIQSAIERFPEETGVYDRLQRWYKSENRPLEALETLEKIVELKPDDAKFRRRLYDSWLARSNPVRALKVREGGSIDVEESNAMRFAAGTVVVYSSGGMVTYLGGGPVSTKSKTEDWPEGKVKPASIERVKEALVEEHDEAAAAVTLRRLWRTYPQGEGRARIVYYFGGQNSTASLKWPEDAEEDEDEDKQDERKRGGLEDFQEREDAEEPEPESAWRVLAERDFGSSEIERLLRTTPPVQLDAMQPVCEALLSARTLRADTDRVLTELLAMEERGAAGKIEYILLLALLDEHPDKITPDLQALLRDLVGMLNPLDAGQLRRLARTHARAGSMAEATRLYRWCATQTQSSSPFAFSAGVRPLSANDLVKEVKETLEKDELLSVIEAILEFADPGEDRWAREGYESLVMETWEEMYGPEVALEKTRAMCTAASDPKTGLRRRTSKRAAYLYARNGDLDRAIECLELGLCKLDPALFESDDPYWRFYPENIGSLSSDDLRRLFPVDCSEWPSASAWLRRCAGALEGWLADERIGESNTAMALALIARRLSALGEIEEAQRVAGVLDTILDLSPEMELWVADAAREVGLPERGDAIERELLEAGKLGIGRLPEVVQHVLETEGPEIAMKLGQAAAELTLHPDLLEVLVRAAEAAQDEARAEHWRSMMESVEQARARLEQLDEEAEHGTGEPKAAARWAR